MSDFRMVRGFEDVWRPPVRPAIKRPEGRALAAAPASARARLARLVARTPEVMVKVSGRTRDPAHLAAHLTYVSRNGELVAEDQDGLSIRSRREVDELARDWAAMELADSRRRPTSPFSIGLVLSMPAGTDAIRLRDAAREFARAAFGGRFDYVFVLHTDTAHPHVHLTVRATDLDGRRLNPKKADLEAWRQLFAGALREHGVEAEATPRRTRGVTRKSERGPLRRLRDRAEAGQGPLPRVRASAYREAAHAAFGQDADPRPWEIALVKRQRAIRRLYLDQAAHLAQSSDPHDRALGAAIAQFVADLAPPDSQRMALARELRAANERAAATRSVERGR